MKMGLSFLLTKNQRIASLSSLIWLPLVGLFLCTPKKLIDPTPVADFLLSEDSCKTCHDGLNFGETLQGNWSVMSRRFFSLHYPETVSPSTREAIHRIVGNTFWGAANDSPFVFNLVGNKMILTKTSSFESIVIRYICDDSLVMVWKQYASWNKKNVDEVDRFHFFYYEDRRKRKK